MWKDFDGTARTCEESAAYLRTLRWTDWRPQGITLHNTAAPTLAQWAEQGASHDARIRNLQSFYENEKGWHAGPHWFISRNFINWFSNPLLPGVHSRCWNATRFGIEMVGDYNSEEFNSGDGALVRDNAVFWIATLNNRFGFDAEDLTFHVECHLDDHDCPGRNVVKSDVIARVKAKMRELRELVGRDGPAGDRAGGPRGEAAASRRFTDIVATVFGGSGEHETSAYDGHLIGDGELGVALPARLRPPLPKVRVLRGGRSVVCDVIDVGPWNTNDPYWETGARPQAETGVDRRGRRTNHAGIDLTPAAARAIGVDGKGVVDWEFVGAEPERHAPPDETRPVPREEIHDAVAEAIGRLKERFPWIAQGAPPAREPVQRQQLDLAGLRQLLERIMQVNAALAGTRPTEMAPPLSPIDKALGGEALVGLKTPLAILAYAGLWIAQVFGAVGPATGDKATTTGSVLTALIAAFGGLGVTAKFDRAFGALSAISKVLQRIVVLASAKPDGGTS